MQTKTSEYRYRVVLDTDSDPVHEWASQEVFTSGLSILEANQWLNPERWTSHGVVQERRCDCCGTWNEVDSVWAFDRHDSHYDDTADGGPVEEGTYALGELPEYVRAHFDEDGGESGTLRLDSLTFLATVALAAVPVSLVVVFVGRLAGAVAGVA